MLLAVQDKLNELVNDSKPLDIEIGFGPGQFILQKAEKYKDVNFVGFEIRAKFIYIVREKSEEKNLTNIYVEKSSANVSIPEKIPAGRVRYIYVNFPDPWWKRKHKKRLILQKDFLNLFYNALQEHGIIYIRTDVKEYADLVEKNFSELTDKFKPVEHDFLDEIMSNREVNCKNESLDIYYLAFQKISRG